MNEPKIYRRTILDELHDFWNGHIHNHMANIINLRTLTEMDEKDIWEYQPIKIGGASGEAMKPILVKDILPKVKANHDRNLRILKTIAKMIQEESKSSYPYGTYD